MPSNPHQHSTRARSTRNKTVSSQSFWVMPFPRSLSEPQTATSTTTTPRSPPSKPTGVFTPSADGTSAPTCTRSSQQRLAIAFGRWRTPRWTRHISTCRTPVFSTTSSTRLYRCRTLNCARTAGPRCRLSRRLGAACRVGLVTMDNSKSLLA